jgi:hypothetical protein
LLLNIRRPPVGTDLRIGAQQLAASGARRRGEWRQALKLKLVGTCPGLVRMIRQFSDGNHRPLSIADQFTLLRLPDAFLLNSCGRRRGVGISNS